MGCHFLLQCMKVKSESEVAQSCLTVSDPMDCECPPRSSPPPQVCPNAIPRRLMVTTVVTAHHPHTLSILLSCCPFLRALSVFLATHSSFFCSPTSSQHLCLFNSLTHNKHLESSPSHNSILGGSVPTPTSMGKSKSCLRSC